MLKRALLCILIILGLSSCSKSISGTPPAATPTIASQATATQAPSVFPSLPPVTPTSSASPTPFTSFTVKPTVENLKLRINPGMAFEALILLQPTDELTVLGTAPGNEWTYIKTADGTEGWVYSLYLQSSVDLSQIPVKEPKQTLLIKGRVVDANGSPIQGVTFDVSQEQDAASSNTVTTDASGTFYSYLPDVATGSWTVSYTAIACKSNVWADATCSTYKNGYTGSVDPKIQTVSLPQDGMLTFTWK